MKSSEHINELAKALSVMQGRLEAAKQDKINPFHKSKYADLNSIWDCLRPHLEANGLCIVQDALTLPEGVSVSTRIMHSSDQWIEFGPLIIPMAKSDAHSSGAAITYAKRYGLAAALGIVSEEDDDGIKAQEGAPKDTKTSPKQKITNDQAEILDFLMGEDEEYRRKVMGYFKLKSLNDITTDIYDKILLSAKRNADKISLVKGTITVVSDGNTIEEVKE